VPALRAALQTLSSRAQRRLRSARRNETSPFSRSASCDCATRETKTVDKSRSFLASVCGCVPEKEEEEEEEPGLSQEQSGGSKTTPCVDSEGDDDDDA
jgi:hypothetical protein